MNPNDLFGDRLQSDPARTRAARVAWVRGGADACGCADCRAWLTQREGLVTSEMRDLLEAFGLDTTRDSAVRALDADEGEGFELLFHLFGTVREEALAADPDRLPKGVLALLVRSGRELAPADWPGAEDSLELRLSIDARDSGAR